MAEPAKNCQPLIGAKQILAWIHANYSELGCWDRRKLNYLRQVAGLPANCRKGCGLVTSAEHLRHWLECYFQNAATPAVAIALPPHRPAPEKNRRHACRR